MTKYIYLLLVTIFLFSCKNGVAPTSDSIQIMPTGKIEGEKFEFVVRNNSSSPVWYNGYGKGSPIYITSVLSDTGWAFSSYAWCGTGVMDVKFEPNEAFKIAISKPNNNKDWNKKWRVSLFIKKDKNGEAKEYWSLPLR